jgi:hypothetical protein
VKPDTDVQALVRKSSETVTPGETSPNYSTRKGAGLTCGGRAPR